MVTRPGGDRARWGGRCRAGGHDDRPGAGAGEGPAPTEGVGDAQRLHELAERYFWLFEDSPVAKYVCDVEGTVLEVNAALCRMLGMRPDELVGRTLASFSVDPPLPAAELEPFLRGSVRTYSGASDATAPPTAGRDGRWSPWAP